jgi:acetylglutamate synthase
MALDYQIEIIESVKLIEQDKLKALIESALKKTLVPGYFESEDITKVFIAGDYVGAAVIESPQIDGESWDYLDKFVVSVDKQGNGVGSALIKVAVKRTLDEPGKSGFFWRCSHKNPYAAWYLKKIVDFGGGCFAKDDWIVFYVGKCQQLSPVFEYALNKPKTLFADENLKL